MRPNIVTARHVRRGHFSVPLGEIRHILDREADSFRTAVIGLDDPFD